LYIPIKFNYTLHHTLIKLQAKMLALTHAKTARSNYLLERQYIYFSFQHVYVCVCVCVYVHVYVYLYYIIYHIHLAYK